MGPCVCSKPTGVIPCAADQNCKTGTGYISNECKKDCDPKLLNRWILGNLFLHLSRYPFTVLFFCTRCVDNAVNFNNNAALCSNSAYLKVIKEHCKKTCGYCGNTGTCKYL